MFQVQINGRDVREVELGEESARIQETEQSFAVHRIREGVYQLVLNNRVYMCKVDQLSSKQFEITMGTRQHQVDVQDEYDQLLERLGLDFGEGDAPDDVVAPMPGRVLDVMTQTGATVEKGEPILVLEAMKMENVIKANGHGTVSAVMVKPGDALEKGQVMVTFQSDS